MSRGKSKAFTLVELLVVIGIIALLLSILLPVISKARQSAVSLKCLSNLRQMGLAYNMYTGEHHQYLPYPTTTLKGTLATDTGEPNLWFVALDPYLKSIATQNRTNVAAGRSYNNYKQCPVYETFEGEKNSGNQGITKEFARSYKMNSHLRHNNPPGLAKITEVKRNAEFVLMGDGISMDTTSTLQDGTGGGAFENGQFSMEVNDVSQANPSLRHNRGANILFVDGHATNVYLKNIIKKPLQAPNSSVITTSWESEYVNGAGLPANLTQPNKTAAAQGLSRNPDMPLIWSDPPKLYRP